MRTVVPLVLTLVFVSACGTDGASPEDNDPTTSQPSEGPPAGPSGTTTEAASNPPPASPNEVSAISPGTTFTAPSTSPSNLPGPLNSAPLGPAGGGGAASELGGSGAVEMPPLGSSSSGGVPNSGGGGSAGSGGSNVVAPGGAPSDESASGGAGGAVPENVDTSAATIVPDPSWACGMPDGVPPPESGQLVFSATLELGGVHEFGTTQYGERRLLDVTGGEFSGEGLSGTFSTGGLDMELTLSNGSIELEQIAILRTSDGTPILLRTCGFAPAQESVVRIVPDFEVANSSAEAWLNDGVFAGTRTVDEAAGTIELAIYDISAVSLGEPQIALVDPADLQHQPWECSTETGSPGSSVFTETVTLGSSVSVGESKRGNRNIIPITGGTVTGRVTGSVLPGGADYQLLGGSATLDARYTLETDDGDFILIRNCGPFGALVPLFETRVDGPNAFLNENVFVSSDPGSANGGVSITFYERQ